MTRLVGFSRIFHQGKQPPSWFPMGMDMLDILFRIEETFGVNLTSDDIGGVVRDRDILVGDLYVLVLKKLQLRDIAKNDVRLSFVLWRDLQQTIHTVTQVPLDRIELKTPLEELFPKKTRLASWEAFRETCPYRIQKLEYPRMVRTAGLLLTFSMVLVELFQLCQVPILNWLWPLVGLFGLWMLFETHVKVMSVLASIRSHFPAGMVTVKDLCRAVLATNYEDLFDDQDKDVEIPIDDRCLLVWHQFTEILVQSLDIDPGQVTLQSKLIQDLGCG